MPLVADLANANNAKNLKEITESLAHGYSYDSSQGELSYENPHDSVWMIFIPFCI